MNKVSMARAALRTVPNLHPQYHERIVNALDAAGLLDNPHKGELARVHAAKGLVQHGRLLPRRSAREAAAASHENERIVQQLNARARRMGFEMPMDQPLSALDVDRAFAGKDVTERLSWKMTASMIGIL